MSALKMAFTGFFSYVWPDNCSARFCSGDENLTWYDYER